MRNVSLRQKVGFGLVGFTLTFVLTLILVIGFAFEPIYYGIQRHNMATLAEDVGLRGFRKSMNLPTRQVPMSSSLIKACWYTYRVRIVLGF